MIAVTEGLIAREKSSIATDGREGEREMDGLLQLLKDSSQQ